MDRVEKSTPPDYLLKVTKLTLDSNSAANTDMGSTLYGFPANPHKNYKISTSTGFEIVDFWVIEVGYDFPVEAYPSWDGTMYHQVRGFAWPTIAFSVVTSDKVYAKHLLDIWDGQPSYSYKHVEVEGDVIRGVFTAPCTITEIRS